MTRRPWRRSLAAVAVVGLVATACGGGSSKKAAPASSSAPLVGLFKIDGGTCADKGVTAGSSFRMVQPGGTPAAGPFVSNGDSPCGDKTWSPVLAGTDGGLRTGDFQPVTDPVFDGGGNGTAARIAKPTKWFAVAFALSTNQKDPQTGVATVKPSVVAASGKLSGDLRSFAAAWNGQHFNQGSPKPDGSHPGATAGPTGSYDASTHRYTLEWTSTVVGGPFNNFTGVWHLEGTFTPAT